MSAPETLEFHPGPDGPPPAWPPPRRPRLGRIWCALVGHAINYDDQLCGFNHCYRCALDSPTALREDTWFYLGFANFKQFHPIGRVVCRPLGFFDRCPDCGRRWGNHTDRCFPF